MGAHMNLQKQTIPALLLALASIIVVGSPKPAAGPDDSKDKKVKEAADQSAKAAKAFDEVMKVPDKSIPRDLLSRAEAVAVFPSVIKVALTFGGDTGRGVVSLHSDGGWGSPVFIKGAGASLGPQVGASSTDF